MGFFESWQASTTHLSALGPPASSYLPPVVQRRLGTSGRTRGMTDLQQGPQGQQHFEEDILARGPRKEATVADNLSFSPRSLKKAPWISWRRAAR